jgi:ABC-2 type transport system permease protein
MTLFLRELKANRKAFIIWSVCMVLLILSGMGKYSAYSEGGDSVALFNDLPHSVKALFGMSSFDVTSMSGYFAMLFLYVELTCGIHAALLGAGILAKEERDKTSEFLMVKPISRASVITSKLLAASLNILLINLITLVSSIMMVSTYNKGESISTEILLFFISMIIVQLIYFSLGAFISALIHNPKSSGSIAIGALLLGYVISRVTDLTDKLNVLNLLSPFKYFNYVDIVEGEGLNIIIFLLSFILISVLTVFTYVFYGKRDLHV